MLYGPFSPVNVPLGLDQEITFIMRLIAEARTRRAAVEPTVAAPQQFLIRLGAAFPGTVWVGGCKNWYTGDRRHRFCGHCRSTSIRRSSTRCRRRIFSSSLLDWETDHNLLILYGQPMTGIDQDVGQAL